MKLLRYGLFCLALTTALAACDSNRNKATLGGTKDTMDVAGAASPQTKDSIQKSLKDSSAGDKAFKTGDAVPDSIRKAQAEKKN